MYRLLSGRLPFEVSSNDPLAWARAVLDTEPRTLGRSLTEARRDGGGDAARTTGREAERDLDAIVRRAMAREPARRYGSMDLLAADLEAFLDARPVAARRGGTWYGFGRFLRRHRAAVSVAGLAALGLMVTTGVALRQAHVAEIEAERLRLAVEYIHEVFRAADPSIAGGGQRRAEDLLDLATEHIGAKLQTHPDLRAPLLVLIATAYSNLGAMSRAVPAFEAAIADLRSHGDGPLELGAALQRGAWAAQRNGDRVQALAWADEAAGLVRGQDPEALRIRDGLAETRWLIAREASRNEEALAHAPSALPPLGSVPADLRDPMRSRALHRIGTSLTDLGRYAEAEAALRESVALAETSLGPDDYRTLRIRQTLGWHYTSRGEPARGLEVLEPVGERLQALFGQHSLEYAGNLHNRANAYRAMGQHERALFAYRESLEAAEAAVDRNSAQIGSLWWNIAAMQSALGRHEEARDALEEAERRWIGTLDRDAPVRGRFFVSAARNALARGSLVDAEAHVRSALASQWSEVDAVEHAEATALAAEVAALRGRAAEAAAAWRDAATLLRRTGDPRRDSQAAAWEAQAHAAASAR
jgi:serine/threonine-protein kinase